VRFRYLHNHTIVPMKEEIVKTTPQNVKEAHEGLFYSRMNLPEAAKHCGMSNKEMKLTFFEYLKYHPTPHYE
jgi:hypothetical protein